MDEVHNVARVVFDYEILFVNISTRPGDTLGLSIEIIPLPVAEV